MHSVVAEAYRRQELPPLLGLPVAALEKPFPDLHRALLQDDPEAPPRPRAPYVQLAAAAALELLRLDSDGSGFASDCRSESGTWEDEEEDPESEAASERDEEVDPSDDASDEEIAEYTWQDEAAVLVAAAEAMLERERARLRRDTEERLRGASSAEENAKIIETARDDWIILEPALQRILAELDAQLARGSCAPVAPAAAAAVAEFSPLAAALQDAEEAYPASERAARYRDLLDSIERRAADGQTLLPSDYKLGSTRTSADRHVTSTHDEDHRKTFGSPTARDRRAPQMRTHDDAAEDGEGPPRGDRRKGRHGEAERRQAGGADAAEEGEGQPRGDRRQGRHGETERRQAGGATTTEQVKRLRSTRANGAGRGETERRQAGGANTAEQAKRHRSKRANGAGRARREGEIMDSDNDAEYGVGAGEEQRKSGKRRGSKRKPNRHVRSGGSEIAEGSEQQQSGKRRGSKWQPKRHVDMEGGSEVPDGGEQQKTSKRLGLKQESGKHVNDGYSETVVEREKHRAGAKQADARKHTKRADGATVRDASSDVMPLLSPDGSREWQWIESDESDDGREINSGQRHSALPSRRRAAAIAKACRRAKHACKLSDDGEEVSSDARPGTKDDDEYDWPSWSDDDGISVGSVVDSDGNGACAAAKWRAAAISKAFRSRRAYHQWKAAAIAKATKPIFKVAPGTRKARAIAKPSPRIRLVRMRRVFKWRAAAMAKLTKPAPRVFAVTSRAAAIARPLKPTPYVPPVIPVAAAIAKYRSRRELVRRRLSAVEWPRSLFQKATWRAAPIPMLKKPESKNLRKIWRAAAMAKPSKPLFASTRLWRAAAISKPSKPPFTSHPKWKAAAIAKPFKPQGKKHVAKWRAAPIAKARRVARSIAAVQMMSEDEKRVQFDQPSDASIASSESIGGIFGQPSDASSASDESIGGVFGQDAAGSRRTGARERARLRMRLRRRDTKNLEEIRGLLRDVRSKTGPFVVETARGATYWLNRQQEWAQEVFADCREAVPLESANFEVADAAVMLEFEAGVRGIREFVVEMKRAIRALEGREEAAG